MGTNEEKDMKLSDFEEDFADSDDGAISDEMYKEMELEQKAEAGEDAVEDEQEQLATLEENQDKQETQEEQTQSEEPEQPEEPEVSPWEKLSQDNSIVKKYIFYISKDFVPYIDNLTTDERNAYINDAIQKKIDFEDTQKQKLTKQKLLIHTIIMILTVCICTPFVFWGAHKAIMATFDNYKYSQENFEKLYKQRFQKDRAYMRSIQYIQEQQKKLKQNK